ncbi:phage tail sheath family protein [Caballeronia sp. dw_19]|uniref:phage tail sheath subtilisin-like domain-containing protein n=1 Tax=Caballeronia sp. dw_19 TaxID=2719791 RepID=UPI001BD26C5A|nr:phage tail sheath family protein [Caballeronia sp. dw_19]
MAATSFFHGVTVSLVDSGPRSIAVPSSSIIGMANTYTPGADRAAPNVPVQLTSYREAVAAFGEGSAVAKAARAIYAQSKAVIVGVGVSAVAEPAALTSSIIGGVSAGGQRTGLQALLDAKSKFNVQPRLILAPGFSGTQAVATAMDALAAKLRGIGIIDGPDTDDEAVVSYAANFGSKRLYMVDPGALQYDTTANSDVAVPASPFAAGLFAQTDSAIGFWASPSNKEIVDITGTKRPIEFLDGDETCRANLLNNAFISTIIRDGGYRLWGNRTLSADPKWSFVTRVRTLDMVMDAVLMGTKWAVDRGIAATFVEDVTESVRGFMRDLKRQGALINFEVYADPDLNTASQIEEGKVYWNIRFSDVIPAENPIFRFEVTNQWLTEVLDTNS